MSLCPCRHRTATAGYVYAICKACHTEALDRELGDLGLGEDFRDEIPEESYPSELNAKAHHAPSCCVCGLAIYRIECEVAL